VLRLSSAKTALGGLRSSTNGLSLTRYPSETVIHAAHMKVATHASLAMSSASMRQMLLRKVPSALSSS